MGSKLMPERTVTLVVNGVRHEITTDPDRTLLDILRVDLHLTGSKEACGKGDCGACVVVMNGRAINSCLVLGVQADGAEIITIEGLADENNLHPLQHHFAEEWAFQCGFCTPGMIMSCYALLLRNPNPGEEEILEAISGNLCRCGSYPSIVQAVQDVVKDSRSPGSLKWERPDA